MLWSAVVLASLLPGSAFPPQTSPLPLERHKGEVVVLNFWASWCAPCRKEMPLLVRLQREYGPRGVRVIGASIDEPEDRELAERFARDVQVNYPIWHGYTTEDMKPLGLATSIPATAIFDRDGGSSGSSGRSTRTRSGRGWSGSSATAARRRLRSWSFRPG